MSTEIRTADGKVVRFVPDPCQHDDALSVTTGGELVAYLCPTCDLQLPPYWSAS